MPWGYGYGPGVSLNIPAPAGSMGDRYTDPNAQQRALAQMSAWWEAQRAAQLAPSPAPAPRPAPAPAPRARPAPSGGNRPIAPRTVQRGGTSGLGARSTPQTTQQGGMRISQTPQQTPMPPPAVRAPGTYSGGAIARLPAGVGQGGGGPSMVDYETGRWPGGGGGVPSPNYGPPGWSPPPLPPNMGPRTFSPYMGGGGGGYGAPSPPPGYGTPPKIGRASCRERV